MLEFYRVLRSIQMILFGRSNVESSDWLLKFGSEFRLPTNEKIKRPRNSQSEIFNRHFKRLKMFKKTVFNGKLFYRESLLEILFFFGTGKKAINGIGNKWLNISLLR